MLRSLRLLVKPDISERIISLKIATASESGLPKNADFVHSPVQLNELTGQITRGSAACLKLHGPPGVGKTSLLQLLQTKFPFVLFEFDVTFDRTVVKVKPYNKVLALAANVGEAEEQLAKLLDELQFKELLQEIAVVLLDEIQLAYQYPIFLTQIKLLANDAQKPIVAAGLISLLSELQATPTLKGYFTTFYYLRAFGVPLEEVRQRWEPFLPAAELDYLLGACMITTETIHLGYFHRLLMALKDGTRSSAFATVTTAAIAWRNKDRFGLCTRAWDRVGKENLYNLLIAMLASNLPVRFEDLLKANPALTQIPASDLEKVVTIADHIGLITEVDKDTIDFSCPFVRDMCLIHMSCISKRQMKPLFALADNVLPTDAASVVMLAASQVNWKEFWLNPLTQNGTPNESAFQQHIFFALCSICTPQQHVLPQMTMAHFKQGAVGWLDHWIDGCKIGLEWLLLTSKGYLQEHLDRFTAKYAVTEFNAACVIGIGKARNVTEAMNNTAAQWNKRLPEHKTVCMFLLIDEHDYVTINIPGIVENVTVLPGTLQVFTPTWVVKTILGAVDHPNQQEAIDNLNKLLEAIMKLSERICDAAAAGNSKLQDVLVAQQALLVSQKAKLEADLKGRW